MRLLVVILLAVSSLSAAPARQTFTGIISDDVCARNGHAAMRMAPSDAECTKLCVLYHGSTYVLEAGSTVYMLSDQKTPATLAAQKVKVTGTLDQKTMTIRVTSIVSAK